MRLEDIAQKAGVSRTTVSNVLHGKTKKVSQATAERVRKILIEEHYLPAGDQGAAAAGTIGFVLGYSQAHGMDSLRDPYVSELVSVIEREANRYGRHVILIEGEEVGNVADIASHWNVEGLIIMGYPEERYRELLRGLDKKMVLLDTFPKGEYDFQNVGIDDYSGGFQVGSYLKKCGYPDALFVAETRIETDLARWQGFKAAMEADGGPCCSLARYLVVSGSAGQRLREYENLLPRFIRAGALAFSSDYSAIEAMKFFQDHRIRVPEQISIVGNDDSIYASFVTPRLTTVRQDVEQKAVTAMDRLLRMIAGETLPEYCVRIPVRLIERDSVKVRT